MAESGAGGKAGGDARDDADDGLAGNLVLYSWKEISQIMPCKAVYHFLSYIHCTLYSASSMVCNYTYSLVNIFVFFLFSCIPISDLSVTVKTGDIPGDSSSWGQVTENGDCPRKPGTSGHPSLWWIHSVLIFPLTLL